MVPVTTRTSSRSLSSGAITYLIHHIFLPPKLPHEDDLDSEFEAILLDTIVDGLLNFKDCAAYIQNGTVDFVISMVTTLRTLHSASGTMDAVNEGELGNALSNVCKEGRYKFHDSCDLDHSL